MMSRSLAALFLGVMLVAPANALDINSAVSDKLAERLHDDLGEREESILLDRLESQVRARLESQGINVDSVQLVLEDASPSKPTFKQMSDRPGLDYLRSISLGGAKISARVFDDKGVLVHETAYKWFENDLTMSIGNGTWSDANRAFNRFSYRLASELDEKLNQAR